MILLTGATGFIGCHLLNALVEKFGKDNVLSLTSVPNSQSQYLLHNNYQFNRSFFADNGYADKIKIIIHAGAFTPKSVADANKWKECNSNIHNTEKLLDAELPALEKVIFMSTIDVYGKAELLSETSPIDPISLYGWSKLYCEKLIEAWSKAANKQYQILRVGHVYGPGEEAYKKIIPITISKIIAGQSLQMWGEGNELRSFIYIDDLVKAIIASINLDNQNGPINLVSGTSISIKQLVEKLIEISKKPVTIEKVEASAQPRDMVFDNTKMNALLTQEVSLDEGLTSEWNYMMNLSDVKGWG